METTTNERKKETDTGEPKVLGLPRSRIGAAIGVLVFIVISILAWEIKALEFVFIGLLLPGILVFLLLSLVLYLLGLDLEYLFNVSPLAYNIIRFGVALIFSSPLAAIIGARLISTDKSVRKNGFTLLVIYLTVLSIIGFCILSGFYSAFGDR